MDGTYSGWNKTGSILEDYLLKLQEKIWIALYGKIQYPEQLLKKIDDYNIKETKDRKKIIFGRDY
ncbi:hypothetical protein ASG38_13075 [Flavobacterium sp. Leaf359]|uniref:hypothetical protein n=1 Tax=Flavobacterium sp. Leaf359 TaxID=1736351 RepID=UPI0006F3718E|nr:hypothetical protein [Flavobacterium sp. Leaf359]KQS46099.1 hypothetical protein ASG38_13075 [Flavobacterium sp. Leaf359]